jgi:hypothetical protein
MLKSLVLVVLALVSTQQALADSKIGEIHGRKVLIRHALKGERFYCSPSDSKKNGVNSTLIQLLLPTFGQTVGLLQNEFAGQIFPDKDGKLCDLVKQLELETSMTYGALEGTFDSVLTMKGQKLVEEVELTVGSTYTGKSSPPARLKFHYTVTQDLKNN